MTTVNSPDSQLAQVIFDTTSEAIMVTNTQNRIISVNPAFTHVTGYTAQEVLGRDPDFLSSGRHNGDFYNRMWEQLQDTGYWQGEIWNRRKNGDLYAEWLSISTLVDDRGHIERYVAIFSDITKRKRAEEKIREHVNFDSLTGLPNRTLFMDRLIRGIMRARQANQKMGLLLLDLDHFKSVNDSLGHHIGDMILQEAATRLLRCVRKADTVSRLGGDEFAVVASDLMPDAMDRVARMILEAMEAPFIIDGETIHLSGSLGVTVYPDDGLEAETLLRNADTAMYRAKEKGRKSYQFFTADMKEALRRQRRLDKELRQAIERKEFVVYFQPVLSGSTGEVVSCEALVRWHHPERGLLGPGEFIEEAEHNGMIEEIGWQVIGAVCAQLVAWQGDPVLGKVRIAVNVSALQLQDQRLPIRLKALTDEYGISRSLLSLEITETLVMEKPERAAEILESLRSLGIRVALDDFGTGYSSLNYLKRFSFDVLKIDRSFVIDLENDRGDAALVEAIIVMAHKLGIAVVAEGVETAWQNQFMIDQSCDYIQGYFNSKPLPSDDFRKFCMDKYQEINAKDAAAVHRVLGQG